MRVIVVEPQCKGYQHARFNAALLATIHCAYPATSIEFYSEAQHAHEVRRILAASGHQLGVLGTGTHPVDWPPNAWMRLVSEYKVCRTLLDRARFTGGDLMVYCSVSSYTIIALKRLACATRARTPIVAVPHAVLCGIHRPTRRAWRRPLDIRAALRLASPANLKFLALSRTIYDRVVSRFPNNHWRLFYHPYLFDCPVPEPVSRPRPIGIGIFGALRTNVPMYCTVIRSVQGGATFSLVGHYAGPSKYYEEFRQLVPGSGTVPISYEEYEVRAKGITYALSLPDPELHFYTASNTLLDALNYGKPGVYLKTPLISEYMAALGDVGYVCEGLGEVVSRIVELATGDDEGRYRSQVRRIKLARAQFTPGALARCFREAVET